MKTQTFSNLQIVFLFFLQENNPKRYLYWPHLLITSVSIVLFLLLAASSVFAQEFLVARVLEVNPQNMELTVVPITDPKRNITVRIAGKNDLPRRDGKSLLPGCVVQGATIRLWGSNERADSPFFLAIDIRGCRRGSCSDPTGVRSRLRKIRLYENKSSEEGGEYSGMGGRGRGGHGNGGGNDGGGGGGGNR